MEKVGVLISLVLILMACDPGEETVAPALPGDVERTTISQGKDYEEQIWFSFSVGSVVATTDKFAWDLEFAPLDEQGTIRLNGSKFMRAAVTSLNSVQEAVQPDDYTFDIDHQSGVVDSLQIGLPTSAINTVYLVDLGRRIDGSEIGWALVQITDVNTNNLNLRYRLLEEHTVRTETIELKENEPVRYSLLDQNAYGGIPPSQDWDICFTQYAYRFYNPVIDYLVNGVLSNTQRVAVAQDEIRTFESITLATVDSLEFSDQRNIIGYDWKSYNIDEGVYQIYPEKNFVIRVDNEVYYKLHFIDFYNASGERGYPLMEWQRL